MIEKRTCKNWIGRMSKIIKIFVESIPWIVKKNKICHFLHMSLSLPLPHPRPDQICPLWRLSYGPVPTFRQKSIYFSKFTSEEPKSNSGLFGVFWTKFAKSSEFSLTFVTKVVKISKNAKSEKSRFFDFSNTGLYSAV